MSIDATFEGDRTMEVFKFDGTLQCGLGAEIPIEAMAAELEGLGAKPTAADKRPWPGNLIQVCGAPTGQCNVYQIDDKDWATSKDAILDAKYGVWPQDDMQQAAAQPGAAGRLGTFQGDRLRGPLMSGISPLENIVWPLGPMAYAPQDIPVPIPLSARVSTRLDSSTSQSELVGKRIRVYRYGDLITKDHRPDRVNIVLDAQSALVVDVWFG